MDRSFLSGLILLAGIALLATAFAIQAILLETVVWTLVLAGAGALLSAWGAYSLRTELGAMMRRRRGEIALYTLGVYWKRRAAFRSTSVQDFSKCKQEAIEFFQAALQLIHLIFQRHRL